MKAHSEGMHMFEPLTLTLAEIAARWNLTPRQLLQHAQQSGMPPLYFDYEGLVFQRNDYWHRHGGDYREVERRDALEQGIRKGDAQLQRRARGTLTEWEQLSAEEAAELRKSLNADQVEIDEIKAKLETRRIERNQRVFRGYVRAANLTLWEVETKGSTAYPPWAFLANEVVALEPMPGHAHDPNVRLTSDHLVAMMPEVKAIEAMMKAKGAFLESNAGTIAAQGVEDDDPQEDSRRMVEWKRSLISNWPAIVRKYGSDPEVRFVMAYLKESDIEGCIVSGDKDNLYWRSSNEGPNGKLRPITRKTLANTVSEFKGLGLLKS